MNVTTVQSAPKFYYKNKIQYKTFVDGLNFVKETIHKPKFIRTSQSYRVQSMKQSNLLSVRNFMDSVFTYIHVIHYNSQSIYIYLPTIDKSDRIVKEVRHEDPVDNCGSEQRQKWEGHARILAPSTQIVTTNIREVHVYGALNTWKQKLFFLLLL